MKKILIYSSNICPYCTAAKELLQNLNLSFHEEIVDNKNDVRGEMLKKSNGRTTVPQIFIGKLHVGGYDDLEAIYKSGELMSLLNE